MTADRASFRSGLFLIVSAASAYAFLPSIVRAIYERSALEPLDLATWRFLIAIPLIWLALFVQRQRSADVPLGVAVWRPLALGVLYAFSVLAAFIGLESIPASIYIVLFYTYPAMVACMSALLGTRLSGLAWFAVALTLVGIILTVPNFFSDFGTLDLGGVLLALTNAFSVAIYYLATGRALRQVRNSTLSAAWIITACGLTIFLSVPLRGLRLPEDPTTWLLIVTLASLSTAYPMFALTAAIQRLGPSLTSLFSTIEPVLGIVLATLLLGEVIVAVQWLGAALIVLAVLMLALGDGRKRRAAAD